MNSESASEPRKGPFNDPASGQDFEALGVVRPLDDLDRPFPDLSQRLAKLVTGIPTICEDVPQPSVTADYLSQHQRRAIAVLHVSGVDHGMNEVALGVGHDVSLAALDLLACVIAARPAAFRRLDALAVDDPSARRSLAPNGFPADQQQSVIERKPKTIVTPQVEPASRRRDRRKAGRQHPPRQPATQQIQDRLDDPPQRPFAVSPYMGGDGKNGSRSAHSASVKSLGKARSARAYCARVMSVHIVELRKFVAKPQNQRLGLASS